MRLFRQKQQMGVVWLNKQSTPFDLQLAVFIKVGGIHWHLSQSILMVCLYTKSASISITVRQLICYQVISIPGHYFTTWE